MAPSIDSRISKIHPFYRIFLLYIEPILALSGAYLAYFEPYKFIHGTAPSSLSENFVSLSSTLTPDPVIQFLSTDIAALYVLFTINEAVVLRLTRDYSVWKTVVFAMLLCDVGHFWGIYKADSVGIFNVGEWSTEELINYGILGFGSALRIAFLLGFGNRK
ncbi:uncharacterized protein EAE98_010806 [Botrytis deweyae]|uniref:DUF7704 domain-containing protein n=2 Tax=Botrytis TaxID=33196 RepID=A0A4Z1K512_9HELO|nr:uncharacterized protein EAE98_010806 [Botrytis deweyae]KAF7909072.1 hypothetical protein EAE99_011553 [Botrytis elliptica]KAF7916221.1 hypothetical protein EAE98_010806 [Botrytis deweyae]TGO79110.1 hypothetical protein BELL_0043g00190 [Botrytis elliptica]